MTSALPTILLDNIFIDLNSNRTVLLAGSGGQLPVDTWLRDCGQVWGRGATLPGITLATAFACDYAEVFAGLPLDRPAIVHLADEDDERIDIDRVLSLRPVHAALIVTIADAEADDPRFSAFARFEEYRAHGQYAAQLREHRGFLFWTELEGNTDYLDEGDELAAGDAL
jgi:hypothetical protein